MTLFQRPIHLKSFAGLLLLLFLGSAILLLCFYVLSYQTIKENSALKLDIEQLDRDIESLATQKVRLSKAPIPSKEELIHYAVMVPNDREVPQFLTKLDEIVNKTGLQMVRLQINEPQPIPTDLLDKILVFLEERSESLPALTNRQQREDFIGNLLAQMDEQYAKHVGGNSDNANATSVDEGPLKRIILHLEYRATDTQLYQFLTQVREFDRLTYIDNIQFDTAKGSMDLTIFYYEGEYPFLPKLR